MPAWKMGVEERLGKESMRSLGWGRAAREHVQNSTGFPRLRRRV